MLRIGVTAKKPPPSRAAAWYSGEPYFAIL